MVHVRGDKDVVQMTDEHIDREQEDGLNVVVGSFVCIVAHTADMHMELGRD